MPNSAKHLVTAVLAMLAAIGSCRDPLAPEDEPYELKSIAGVPLPAPYAPNPSFNGRIFAGSLALGKNGRGTWSYTAESSVGGERHAESQQFSYTLSGNALTIHLDCQDTVSTNSCIAGPHLVGTLGERRITIETSNVMRVPVVYESTAR